MSICPEQDMHSVYLDGELPQKYALDYESHLTSCQQCRDDFLKLQAISNTLKDDAHSIQLSEQDMEDSFSRLQTKLHYQKTVKNIQPQNIKRFTWVVPTAAAAALAFALIVPLRTGNIASTPVISQERPISISASALTGDLSVAPSLNYQKATFFRDPIIAEEPLNHIQTVSLSSDEVIAPVDIFRPSFDTNQGVSIKMTLSNLNSIPVQGKTTGPIQMLITISGE